MAIKIKNDIRKRSKEFLLDQKIIQKRLGLTDNQIKQIKKQLPDKKYYEFGHYMFNSNKFKNLEYEWNNWQHWILWHYPVYDLNKFNRLILQNAKYIKNKRILDIGCNLGILSLLCLHLDCKKVTGFDIRENKLKLAEFICKKYGSDRHEFKKVNLQNYADLLKVSQKIDTIIFAGVIYHVPNHYDILRTLSNSKASTMIIQNRDSEQFWNNPKPNIAWTTEITENPQNGFDQNLKEILVGRPNQAWINHAMKELGWKLIKHEQYLHRMGSNDNVNHPRSFAVFER